MINLSVRIIVGAHIGGFPLSPLLPGTFGISGYNLGSLIVAFSRWLGCLLGAAKCRSQGSLQCSLRARISRSAAASC
jgi:hypothetical protein